MQMPTDASPIRIHQLEIENVKRVRAVKMEPSRTGLTVIGGRNNQGKTSVLDAIAWALGGDRFRPSQAARDGSTVPPSLHITLSNGLVVERRGKNGSLHITDPAGVRSGQSLLNGFIEPLALDLPRFMNSQSSEKAKTLLRIIGVEEALAALEISEQRKYNERHAIGQIHDQKAKYAKEMPHHKDVPKQPVSASELIRQQQDILYTNGENQRKRAQREALETRLAEISDQMSVLQTEWKQVRDDLEIAKQSTEHLQDRSTAELERSIQNIEAINIKVRANLDRERAEMDAEQLSHQYAALSDELHGIRAKKRALLEGANMPLPGLTVQHGELSYNGHPWDGMSGSEQLMVATAIVRALNPQCGFVLLDKLEQLDMDTLDVFGKWLQQEGLQAIATRVSTGAECALIIEDGYAVADAESPPDPPSQSWKAGEF